MAEPTLVNTAAEQLHIDFGDRFSEVAWKETDRVVLGILKGLAILGLDEAEANAVMSTIARYAPDIAGHAEKE